jgi:hypothetical protein
MPTFDVICELCGNEVYSEFLPPEELVVSPCQTCMDKAAADAYNEGFWHNEEDRDEQDGEDY